MKNLKFRNRLFIAFCGVLIVATVLPGLYMYQSLKREILAESTQKAIDQLEVIDWLLEKDQPFLSGRSLDQWCTETGEKLNCRITIIKHGGAVIADSSVARQELRYLENHSDRKEIRAATADQPAVSVRYSDTTKQRLIYAARQVQSPAHSRPVYLRAAYPVSSVDARLQTYTGRFWLALAAILALTFGLSIYLARRLEQPIYKIMDRLKGIARGDFSHQYIMDAGDEFYQLSMTLNETADRISEQMEVISEQNREMEAIIENMREGVMLIDKAGRIKAINQAMGQIAECQLSCIGKRPLEAFLNSEVQAACDKILQGTAEYNITLNMGEERFYDMYAVKIAEGGALIVFYNVSEQLRLEKIRRDFVANVSHELKTPLTSIKGYVETLLSGGFSMNDQARSFLGTIEKNTTQMTGIVNDLLQLTRLQENPMDLEIKPVQIGPVFEKAWETCRLAAEQKQIRIDNRLPTNLVANADPAALTRVFGNLADNAIRYSPQGGIITVSAQTTDTEAVFSIRDQGPGIAPKHRERIFERFYRVDKERSRALGGTGLGLSICKHAVSAMNGRIWVQSPPEREQTGSVFFFTLPRDLKPAESNHCPEAGGEPRASV
ncbi:MAG: cell wall metabolism sensor histidine kinase WalK [Desulfobacteraceae bacterium]|nr:cell wall metabolism sensor histidine kinase WalK [Desulfobacteraceae bacterium]